jgi:hypothetical protein
MDGNDEDLIMLFFLEEMLDLNDILYFLVTFNWLIEERE